MNKKYLQKWCDPGFGYDRGSGLEDRAKLYKEVTLLNHVEAVRTLEGFLDRVDITE